MDGSRPYRPKENRVFGVGIFIVAAFAVFIVGMASGVLVCILTK